MVSGSSILCTNPATLEVIGEVAATAIEDIPGVISRARESQREWAELPIKRRQAILRNVQRRVIKDAEGIARLVSMETGKPYMESLATDVMNALSVGDFAVERMPWLFRRSRIDFGSLSLIMRYMGRTSTLVPRPIGVVGVISPWNYPLAIPYSGTMMAMAAGNAVILKPSSRTPLSALRIQEIMVEAGVPSGLMQVVLGNGGEIGEALVRSPIDRIVFTGSTAVGKRIMELASHRLIPVTLELGGKDPFIVLRDANLERAAKAASWGAFVNCGQTCVAVKRILVHTSVFDDFQGLLLSKVGEIKQGYDLEDRSITVGSLISERAVEEMEAHVERAVEQGGKVLIGGRRLERRGNFFPPTVIAADRTMDIAVQEVFGPIVVLMRFESEEEAVEIANGTPFALSGSVWTEDIERGTDLASRILSGTMMVNNVAYTYGLGGTPWGGRGDSGFGRVHGDMGFEELLDRQHIHVDGGRFSSEIWWPPYGNENTEAMRDLVGMAFNGERDKLLTRVLKARRLMRR